MTTGPFDRYSRQTRFSGLAGDAQAKLAAARVLLCGCGALGTVLADTLVRAGVGYLRIVDRDFVDLSNLQRQVLFDEQDVHDQLPKAIAATRKLQRINSTVQIEPIVADIRPDNILGLVEGVDLILDGTDNFETRFLINDAALTTGRPWVYGGCVGSQGQSMTIIPGQTACLRCVIDSPPEAGSVETCDTAGVIAPAIHMVTALQAVAALKILTGQAAAITPTWTVIDVWDQSFRTMSLAGLRDRGTCPACHGGERAWLEGTRGTQTVVLCGRNSVQISPATPLALDWDELVARWQPLGTVTRNPYLVRLRAVDPACEVTVFRDGRAILQGTDDPATARTWYARFIGG